LGKLTDIALSKIDITHVPNIPSTSWTASNFIKKKKTRLTSYNNTIAVLPPFVFHMHLRPRLKDQGKKLLDICNASFPLLIKAIINRVAPPSSQPCPSPTPACTAIPRSPVSYVFNSQHTNSLFTSNEVGNRNRQTKSRKIFGSIDAGEKQTEGVVNNISRNQCTIATTVRQEKNTELVAGLKK
jgi:hypothetical protein